MESKNVYNGPVFIASHKSAICLEVPIILHMVAIKVRRGDHKLWRT
jgi:hypothetical protein